MIYTFELNPVTPEEIEKTCNLPQGAIRSLTISPGGAVDIAIDDSVASDTVKAKILEKLKEHNLPRGKKAVKP